MNLDSFKRKDGKWWVACPECTNGINGDQTCSNGIVVKDLKAGCSRGKLLEKPRGEE